MPNTGQLLTPSQMAQIRDVALMGMVTPVTIERRSEDTSPAANAYGDDAILYTTTNESRRQTVNGWFYSTPTPVQQVDTGMIVTVNTYRLYLPVGTDVLPGDLVHVGVEDYTVSDTTAEGSWLPLLTCSLRKRE